MAPLSRDCPTAPGERSPDVPAWVLPGRESVNKKEEKEGAVSDWSCHPTAPPGRGGMREGAKLNTDGKELLFILFFTIQSFLTGSELIFPSP